VRPIARGDWQIPGIGVTPHSRVQVSGMKRSSGAAVWSCSTAPAAAPCRQLRGAAPQSCSCSTLIRRPSRGCRSARGCRLHIIADGRRLIAVRTGGPWMSGPSRRHHPQGACGWRRLRMGGGQPPKRSLPLSSMVPWLKDLKLVLGMRCRPGYENVYLVERFDEGSTSRSNRPPRGRRRAFIVQSRLFP
jgi:hypothetical protein